MSTHTSTPEAGRARHITAALYKTVITDTSGQLWHLGSVDG